MSRTSSGALSSGFIIYVRVAFLIPHSRRESAFAFAFLSVIPEGNLLLGWSGARSFDGDIASYCQSCQADLGDPTPMFGVRNKLTFIRIAHKFKRSRVPHPWEPGGPSKRSLLGWESKGGIPQAITAGRPIFQSKAQLQLHRKVPNSLFAQPSKGEISVVASQLIYRQRQLCRMR
jgi:hypothetical protein